MINFITTVNIKPHVGIDENAFDKAVDLTFLFLYLSFSLEYSL